MYKSNVTTTKYQVQSYQASSYPFATFLPSIPKTNEQVGVIVILLPSFVAFQQNKFKVHKDTNRLTCLPKIDLGFTLPSKYRLLHCPCNDSSGEICLKTEFIYQNNFCTLKIFVVMNFFDPIFFPTHIHLGHFLLTGARFLIQLVSAGFFQKVKLGKFQTT